ncbi:MAG: hypothetical protein LBS89_06775 [Zoogloeaceae bacterium]|jgi:hypothetical protein|nr:hypothetical protein [Zoogloeaceae bacterium]
MNPRLLLLHKQKTSGRLRYLSLPTGMLLSSPLPEDARLFSTETAPPAHVLPAGFLPEAEAFLALPPGSIEGAPECSIWASSSAGDVPILLGAFTTTDPPFAAAENRGGRFITLTEARGMPQIELEIMRRAYEHVLG